MDIPQIISVVTFSEEAAPSVSLSEFNTGSKSSRSSSLSRRYDLYSRFIF
jgi:hypothetical protein